MRTLLIIIASINLASCAGVVSTYKSRNVLYTLIDSDTFKIEEYSLDPDYGFVESNPIMVGGAKQQEGPQNERRFLNALAGPNGEPISYYREGSCCMFKTQNGFDGKGFLDSYLIQYIQEGGDTIRKVIYINMYDSDSLKIPMGFTRRTVRPCGLNVV